MNKLEVIDDTNVQAVAWMLSTLGIAEAVRRDRDGLPEAEMDEITAVAMRLLNTLMHTLCVDLGKEIGERKATELSRKVIGTANSIIEGTPLEKCIDLVK